mmetsp:Transcript_9114/g.19826  ORF Transcript_9114/g.19826 Transcript_9114/m.19826 type:complete len:241 (-) Transcript_9114:135-857(-)
MQSRRSLWPDLERWLPKAEGRKEEGSGKDGPRAGHADPVPSQDRKDVEHHQHQRCGPTRQSQAPKRAPASIGPPAQEQREAEREGEGPCRASTWNTKPSQCNSRICVMPCPPQKLRTTHVVGCIEKGCQKACKARFCDRTLPSMTEDTSGRHSRPVHEQIVYARNIEWHSWGQHQNSLCLPEIVHHRQQHKNVIVDRTHNECRHPNQLQPTKLCVTGFTNSVQERESCQNQEQHLGHDKR